MLGNILSALVWIQSTTFASYMLSRIIGGLSEGNVQLAIAILSDVTSAANRSKALAFVGIAFAICFCIGPPIGAYFASRPFPPNIIQGIELNIYATPAALTLVLLVLETVFLSVALPETRFSKKQEGESVDLDLGDTTTSPATSRSVDLRGKSVQDRLRLLGSLSTEHFLFLGIFSGVEFTLTFLTFDRECPILFGCNTGIDVIVLFSHSTSRSRPHTLFLNPVFFPPILDRTWRGMIMIAVRWHLQSSIGTTNRTVHSSAR
jgi:MFS family permease